MVAVISVIAGVALGIVLAWLYFRSEVAVLNSRLAAERAAAADKLAILEDARARLADSFRALSAEALQTNNQAFLDLAKRRLGQFQESARGDLAPVSRRSMNWSNPFGNRSPRLTRPFRRWRSGGRPPTPRFMSR